MIPPTFLVHMAEYEILQVKNVSPPINGTMTDRNAIFAVHVCNNLDVWTARHTSTEYPLHERLTREGFHERSDAKSKGTIRH